MALCAFVVLWFQLDDVNECLDWLVQLSSVLAKAPYKDMDNALTLVNTGRTDVRGQAHSGFRFALQHSFHSI